MLFRWRSFGGTTHVVPVRLGWACATLWPCYCVAGTLTGGGFSRVALLAASSRTVLPSRVAVLHALGVCLLHGKPNAHVYSARVATRSSGSRQESTGAPLVTCSLGVVAIMGASASSTSAVADGEAVVRRARHLRRRPHLLTQ